MASRNDRVFVRAHVRRRPTPGGAAAARGSGWLIAGAVAAFWLWSHFVGFSAAPPAAPPPTPVATAVPAAPAPAASASAAAVPAEIGAP